MQLAHTPLKAAPSMTGAVSFAKLFPQLQCQYIRLVSPRELDNAIPGETNLAGGARGIDVCAGERYLRKLEVEPGRKHTHVKVFPLLKHA
jgi:hypothetical protein